MNGRINAKELFDIVSKWSNDEPELTAEMVVEIDRLYSRAYAEGFSDCMRARTTHKDEG